MVPVSKLWHLHQLKLIVLQGYATSVYIQLILGSTSKTNNTALHLPYLTPPLVIYLSPSGSCSL